jgi:hypothetical protein
MDAGMVSNSPAEMSIDLLREHRDEMAVWLALEVLQLAPVATGDPELVSRLTACQERLEERLRSKAAANRADRPGRATRGKGKLVNGDEPDGV